MIRILADGTVDRRPELEMARHVGHVEIDPGVFITEVGEWRYYMGGELISEAVYHELLRYHYPEHVQPAYSERG